MQVWTLPRTVKSKYFQVSNHDFKYNPLSTSITTVACDNIVSLFRGVYISNVVTLGINDHSVSKWTPEQNLNSPRPSPYKSLHAE